MSEVADKIAACAAELGVTMTAQFVPWSQSRNKGEDHRSLNWRVTLRRTIKGDIDHEPRTVDILTTDYSAGEGHAPSYKQLARQTADYRAVIDAECETGYPQRHGPGASPYRVPGSKQVMPELADVLASLVMDSDVLDHNTFESWASDCGYDPDSRKAEAIYRACLDIALKLRNGLSEDGLAKLRTACEGY